jgi:hypothetical protein
MVLIDIDDRIFCCSFGESQGRLLRLEQTFSLLTGYCGPDTDLSPSAVKYPGFT